MRGVDRSLVVGLEVLVSSFHARQQCQRQFASQQFQQQSLQQSQQQ